MATAAPSWQDLYNDFVTEAKARASALTFDDGDISDQVAAGSAAIGDHVTGWAAGRMKALYLDGAEGDDLTVLADDHWNVQRQTASYAVGVYTFTRTVPGPAGTIAAGTEVATSFDAQGQQVRFTTDADVNWALNETGSNTVNITAEVAGSAGNVAANAIANIVTSIFDTSITGTNGTATAGGNEEEDDDSLRARVRALPASQQKGTLAALEYGAKTVLGVRVATAVADATGLVTLYISDANGGSSQPMIDAVKAIMPDWKCAGEVVNVAGGTLYTQNVILSLTVKTGVDAAALVAKVQAAVTARLAKLGAGETLTRTTIRMAAVSVDPDNITEVTVTTPATDVAPLPNQVIRVGTVTVS